MRKKLCNLYCSPSNINDKIEEEEMGGICRTDGRNEKCINNFSRKPEGKRPLLKHSRSWEDTIKMDLEIVC
jgi:hypothetical protein